MTFHNQIISHDALTGLRTLPDAAVQCIVTSPPYWGKRQYDTPHLVWGGETGCKHDFTATVVKYDNHIPKAKRFIYADPPYLDSTNPYNTPAWSIQDTNDLLDTLLATGIRFAVSEFNHPDVVQAATDRGLTVLELGDRRAITSEQRKTDILIINYPKPLFKQLEIGMDQIIEKC